eukprot:7228327-Prymnesium_polylepis.1
MTLLLMSLPSSVFRLPSSVFRLPASVFRLPSSVFRLYSSRLPSSVRTVPIGRQADSADRPTGR